MVHYPPGEIPDEGGTWRHLNVDYAESDCATDRESDHEHSLIVLHHLNPGFSLVGDCCPVTLEI